MCMKLGILLGIVNTILMGSLLNTAQDATKTYSENNTIEVGTKLASSSGFSTTSTLSELELSTYGTLDEDVAPSVTYVNTTETSASVTISWSFTDSDNSAGLSYYIGYGEDYRPCLVYEVETISGDVEVRETNLNISSSTGLYDLLGNIGSSSVTSYVDIELNAGEEILLDNFVVYNFFQALYDTDARSFYIETDDNGDYVGRYSVCSVSSLTSNALSDYISIEYLGKTSYGDYGAIQFNVNTFVDDDFYRSIDTTRSTVYNSNSGYISSGRMWVRTRFYFASGTRVYAYYDNSDEPVIYSTDVNYVDVTDPDSKMVILIDGLEVEGLTNVVFYGLYVNVDIYDSSTDNNVRRSEYSVRYSYMETGFADLYTANGTLYLEGNEGYSNNLSNIYWWTMVGFMVAYEAVSIFMYFYLKEKYKDDEFKRMRTKQYWETNTLGLVATTSLFMFIMTVIYRCTFLANSLSVTNPLDKWIMIFGILTIIFCGYFIKYFINQIKNIIDKNRNEKLKLNADIDDDGTLNLAKK